MIDFISREDVLQILSQRNAPWDAYAKVQALPAAKLTNSGNWVLKTFDDGYGDYQLYECDICGEVTAQRRNYCPFCGADMRGGEQ